MGIFNSVPSGKLPRSTFDLSHETKLSFNFGGLYPILTEQVLPGDQWSVSVQNFVRSMPLLSPVMHRNDLKLDAFFVPYALIWKDYEKAIMLGEESDSIPVPRVGYGGDSATNANRFYGIGSLTDHFGANVDPSGAYLVNALPFRAYQLIYNEYFRNPNLENEITVKTDSDDAEEVTDTNIDDYCLQFRSWRRDYFTSALPEPQKGSPVRLPESDLSVYGDGHFNVIDASGTTKKGDLGYTGSGAYERGADIAIQDSSAITPVQFNSGLSVEKSNSPTIEDLRYAESLQEFYEAQARGGNRFKEWLLNIWHTLSPDLTLDRPAYLGGYRGPIQISEVPQTSQGTETSAQGTLAGKASTVGNGLLFKRYHFKQPGLLMVIMSVVPKSSYQQGTRRFMMYRNGFDFPNPYFANLGEQPIWRGELYDESSDYYGTFGYTPRYAECKYIPDTVHGLLRSDLSFWHEGRIFAAEPTLSTNFVKMYPEEVNRIYPDLVTTDKLIGEFMFNIKAKRSLPYYGVPRLQR